MINQFDKTNNKMKEPLSEDDYPNDRIVSFRPIEAEGERRSFNFIKEEGQDFFRPLNVHIESSEYKEKSGNTKKNDVE